VTSFVSVLLQVPTPTPGQETNVLVGGGMVAILLVGLALYRKIAPALKTVNEVADEVLPRKVDGQRLDGIRETVMKLTLDVTTLKAQFSDVAQDVREVRVAQEQGGRDRADLIRDLGELRGKTAGTDGRLAGVEGRLSGMQSLLDTLTRRGRA